MESTKLVALRVEVARRKGEVGIVESTVKSSDLEEEPESAPPNGWRCAALPVQAADASIEAHGAAPTKEALRTTQAAPRFQHDAGNVSTSALLGCTEEIPPRS